MGRQWVARSAGEYAANGAARLEDACMPTLGMTAKSPDMPGRNPFRGKELRNEEEPRGNSNGHARYSSMAQGVFVKLQSTILRKFRWLSLLSGLRRNDLATLRWTDVECRERPITLRGRRQETSFRSTSVSTNGAITCAAPALLIITKPATRESSGLPRRFSVGPRRRNRRGSHR